MPFAASRCNAAVPSFVTLNRNGFLYSALGRNDSPCSSVFAGLAARWLLFFKIIFAGLAAGWLFEILDVFLRRLSGLAARWLLLKIVMYSIRLFSGLDAGWLLPFNFIGTVYFIILYSTGLAAAWPLSLCEKGAQFLAFNLATFRVQQLLARVRDRNSELFQWPRQSARFTLPFPSQSAKFIVAHLSHFVGFHELLENCSPFLQSLFT